MDKPQDFAACKKIEIARCELRNDCKGFVDPDANPNFSKRFPGFDLDTCITYAKEHCRTRKIGTSDSEWDGDDLDGCIAAIGALYPVHCGDLSRSKDETEFTEIAVAIEDAPDDGGAGDAGVELKPMAEWCWFIEAPEEEDEEDSENEE